MAVQGVRRLLSDRGHWRIDSSRAWAGLLGRRHAASGGGNRPQNRTIGLSAGTARAAGVGAIVPAARESASAHAARVTASATAATSLIPAISAVHVVIITAAKQRTAVGAGVEERLVCEMGRVYGGCESRREVEVRLSTVKVESIKFDNSDFVC
jgi:hypothetical protein